MKKIKSSVHQSLFIASMFLLIFVFCNIAIPSILFVFKISINKIPAILSIIIAVISSLLLIRRFNIKNNFYKYGLCLLLPICIICISLFVSSKLYDYTWDGNSYHKGSIGFLINGWNPVYESMEEFDSKSENPIGVKENVYMWGNHYAMASHIYAASLGSLFNDIEIGKSINLISMACVFLLTMSIILNRTNNYVYSFIYSILIISIPTIVSQMFTTYVDLLVYLYLFMLMIVFFYFEYSDKICIDKNILLICYFMILSVLINIKFSAFAYAGIFCLGYYFWYIYRMIKKDMDCIFFKKLTICSIFAVVAGVAVIGLSIYPKNFIEHKNPFYPLFGENKVDIMTANQPEYFENKSAIEKFTIATFSKADNISRASGLKAEYKIPFSFYKSEYENLYACDLRISGNGVFFSGVLIISIIILLLLAKKTYLKNKNLFFLLYIPISITVIMTFVLQESWWARYFPQLHFIPLGAIIILYNQKKDIYKVILYFVCFVLLINNGMIFIRSSINAYNESKQGHIDLNNVYTTCSSKKISLYTNSFQGAYYNFSLGNDYYINYEITEPELGYYGPFMKSGFVYWRCIE